MGGRDVAQRRLGLDLNKVDVVIDGVGRPRGVGHLPDDNRGDLDRLPSASLTFRWLVSKFLTRMLRVRRSASGTIHQRPVGRTVPT